MLEKHLNIYRQLTQHLILRARKASEQNLSWRNFAVGCAILAWKPGQYISPLQGYQIFTGTNMKPVEGGHNLCAEQSTLGAIRTGDFSEVVAVCVVGQPQPDTQSGVVTKTLHPCGNCRQILKHSQVVFDDTIILTAGLSGDVFEEQSMHDLWLIHQPKPA